MFGKRKQCLDMLLIEVYFGESVLCEESLLVVGC
jgi:hypothetical protein